MSGLKSQKVTLAAGGGSFALSGVTLGIFLNDQPTYRLAVSSDHIQEHPLKAQEGWILPAQASGLCEYDDVLDVVMVEIETGLMAEVGLEDPQSFAPVIGAIDPVTLNLALNLEVFAQGETLYRETMYRALAAHLSQSLTPQTNYLRGIEDRRLRRALSYIHDHLSDDLSLEHMADVAAISPYHFSRAFKEATGKSPLQYVIKARIDWARVLLKTTKLTVAEVCYRVGYQDLSRFGQHFKRLTGTTPAKFRT